MPKIYTKKGDLGESSIKGERLRKDALVFDVLGDLDELNSWLGCVQGVPTEMEVLTGVQIALMDLCADIAGYKPFVTNIIPILETHIDVLMPNEPFKLKPPLGHFHIVRTVCRRAERHLVAYNPHHNGIQFLNRLSDYLYVLGELARKDIK